MALTDTEVDAAVPAAGTPDRTLTNAALKELIVDVAAKADTSHTHTLSDVSDAGALAAGDDATDVPFTPSGGIAATDVDGAIQELDAEKQATSAELTALAAVATTGQLVRTASATYLTRTLTGPAAGITVTNGSGVAGNPTLALANDLAALEALATTGFPSRTGTDTWAQRTLTAPAAGFTITNPAGIAGNPTFVLANDLAALEALNTNGIASRTAANTWAIRTLAAPAAGITITNPGGVTGNPTFALANDLAGLEGLGSTGFPTRTASDTWAQRSVAGTTDQITVTNGDGVSGNPTIAAVVASQAEAEAGTDTTKLMTAQRTAQAIAALAGGGTDDQTAAEVPFTPAGNIAATNTQAAIEELDSEKTATTVTAEIDGNVDDLITLSGVAENATDLGTFTGTTIADTETVKGALQDLETALEALSASSGIPASTVDAKGDLIAATADDTVARLAVGTDNQFLKAASGQTTGLQWATPDDAEIAASGSATNYTPSGATVDGNLAGIDTALGEFSRVVTISATGTTTLAEATHRNALIKITTTDAVTIAAPSSGSTSWVVTVWNKAAADQTVAGQTVSANSITSVFVDGTTATPSSTSQVKTAAIFIATPADEIIFNNSIGAPYTIIDVDNVVSSGSITAAFAIEDSAGAGTFTDITGMSAVTVTTTRSTDSASANNVATDGDQRLRITLSSNSSAAGLELTFHYRV